MNTHNELNFTTDVNEVNIHFNDIFNLEEIQRLQDLFSNATGVASIITSPNGTPFTKPSNFCHLCKDIIRKTEKGCSNCFKSDAIIGTFNAKGPTLQPCLSGGLWDAGASISVGNKHVANWIIGQIRDEEIDEKRMIEYAEEIGVDRFEFLEALKDVPVMSIERFKMVADMLFVYANDLSEKIFTNLQLKTKIKEKEKANELIYKSEELLSITLQSIGDGVISTDINGLIVNMNPVAEKLCGWKLKEATGKVLDEVFNIVNASTRKSVENPVKKVIEQGEIVGLANHTVLISKNGTEYHIADSAAPIKNIKGIITGVVLVFSDVTEKYIAEERIKESERSNSVLLSNLPGFAYRCKFDHQWTKEFVSEGFLHLTGYRSEDIINNRKLSFNDIILPEYRELLWNVWGKAVKYHHKVSQEYKILTADNQIKWVWEQGIAIYKRSGEVDVLEGLIIDITDRKLTEEKLQNERLLLRTLIDNIPDLIYTKDLLSRKTLANKAEVVILGANTEAEVLGLNDFDLYPKEFAEKFYADDQMVFTSGFPILNKEESILDKNGNKQWMLFSKLPFQDIDNRTIGLIGIGHDITKRKKLEIALLEKQEFLNKVQLIANLGNCMIDIPTKTWKSSEIMDSIIGIDQTFEKTFKNLASIIHPEWIEIVRTYFLKDVVENRNKFDIKFKIIRPVDLKERWIHVIGELKTDEENRPVKLIVTIQDITDRRNTAEELRKSEELYRSILNASPDAIVVVDISGRIKMVSPTAVSMYKCESKDQIIGRNMFEIIVPDDFDRAKLNVDRLFQGISEAQEYEIKRLNGELFYAEITGDIIWSIDGEPTGIVFIVRDISDRKKVEVALKSSQLELKAFASHLQNVREEEKIQLAREIHDELGQILIAIKIDLGMMKQKVLKSIKPTAAESILTNFDTLFALVDNTINTTRKIMTDLRPEVLFLIGFVEAVKLYANTFKERYQLMCLFENNVSELKLNSQQAVALYRILQESLTNIAKHAKATKVKIYLGIEDGKLVMEVKDNGVGFNLNRDNKPNSYGLLGMKERVYLLDGVLFISSVPEEGTSIKVEMPYFN